ncbi:MAG: hypothetical protein IJQ23_06055 [Clostridia bacterium]|nr:hypothetical protein [Clostridia bacterium]
MVEYYTDAELDSAKKQKKKTLIIYFIVLGVFVLATAAFFAYYLTLPYSGYRDTARIISRIKWGNYSLTAIFVIFSFIYLGIVYKRVRRYYKMCVHLSTGLRETTVANFIEYDETIQDKDGVDFKSLIFLEWNKYKQDFFERKVLVFYEKPFPEIPEQANVSFVTQGNVLISYEILS